jgi:CubicO group peptidase (beta-lactamase class C family)
VLSERDHDRQSSTAILNGATLATIDRWVAYRVWHSHVPGAQVAIGLGNELVFSAAYGYADLEQRTPMRTDHLFRVASHSKTFTATLILQLVEERRLSLDDRVGNYVAELRDHELGDIVLRELLEHTSGVLRDGEDADFWLGSRPFPDYDEMITLVSAGAKRSPGELFAYSNLGFGLLGAVLSSVIGRPYAEIVRQQITEPLNLTNTAGRYLSERADDYARGYSGLSTGLQRQRLDHVDTGALDAAAGVTSTAEDLVSYFGAHSLGDVRLLSDRAKRLMQRTANITDPSKPDGPSYGLGMAAESFDEHRVVGHGGGYPGHITRSLLDPETALVVVALTNAIDGPASQLAAGVLKLVDDALAHPATGGSLFSEVLDRAGRYQNLWGMLDIGVLGSRLLATHLAEWDPLDGADELEVIDHNKFRIVAGSGYGSIGESVTFSADGSLRYGSMTLRRVDELEERGDIFS